MGSITARCPPSAGDRATRVPYAVSAIATPFALAVLGVEKLLCHLAPIDASFTYLREFAPYVIAGLEFDGSREAKLLVAAVEVLRELYAKGGRKVPDGAPAEFAPTRWRGYLDHARKSGNATAYLHYWELCTLLGLGAGALRVRAAAEP